jgi:hypothetical protein
VTAPRLRPDRGERIVQVKTNVKSGGISMQHNEAQVRGLKVRTNVKAGFSMNYAAIKCAR